jgi:hypothetical protein
MTHLPIGLVQLLVKAPGLLRLKLLSRIDFKARDGSRKRHGAAEVNERVQFFGVIAVRWLLPNEVGICT